MSPQNNYLFIDRDGTLIVEPSDQQVDHIDKLQFLPGVFTALSTLQQAGYCLVMVTNQDGLGTDAFPQAAFDLPHQFMLSLFRQQGIEFDGIHICPHLPKQGCSCRKPEVGLMMPYLMAQSINKKNSFVIGDRDSDMVLAKQLNLPGIQIGKTGSKHWSQITTALLQRPRRAMQLRQTAETDVRVRVNLDHAGEEASDFDSGSYFLNHMLEQLAKHSGMAIQLSARGDWQVDDHHTVEDIALVLGAAIREALGNKRGITRYGFVLPMDESLATIALDLSGRPHLAWQATFERPQIGDIASEMIPHFFSSFADGLRATLHITLSGKNDHHQIEAAFKGLARALRQAVARGDNTLPSTKGVL